MNACLYYLTSLVFLTSSFDIFLQVNIPFTIRISQLFLVLCFMMMIASRGVSYEAPVAIIPLSIWAVFSIIFSFNNEKFLIRGIAYDLWLIFSIATVFLFLNTIKNERRFFVIYKIYLISFVFISGVGLLQFILPIIGFQTFLVQQWWIPGFIVRVNGFSYEPSYYAAYLLLGWISLFVLTTRKTYVFDDFIQKTNLLIISAGVIVSSSRTAIVFMFMILIVDKIISTLKFIFMSLKIKRNSLYFFVSIVIIGLFGLPYLIANIVDYDFLLAGTGLMDTADHSVVARYQNTLHLWKVFISNPFVGFGLGGLSPAVGESLGVVVNSNELAKLYEGNVIMLEVFAASGLIGGGAFVIYLITLTYKIVLLTSVIDSHSKSIILSISMSLLGVFILLQFNQNILRLYLWVHLGLLSCAYSLFSKKFRKFL